MDEWDKIPDADPWDAFPNADTMELAKSHQTLEPISSEHKYRGPRRITAETMWESAKSEVGPFIKGQIMPMEAGKQLGQALGTPEGREEVWNQLSNIVLHPIESMVHSPIGTLSLGLTPMIAGGSGALSALKKTRLPEKLYGGSIHAPTSRKWLATLGPEDISAREEAISAGLKSRVRPTEFQEAKVKHVVEDLGEAIGKSAEDAQLLGASTINVKTIIDKGMSRSYKNIPNTSNPIRAKAYLDKLKSELSNRPETMTIEEANKFKQQLYKEVSWPETTAKSFSMQLKESSFKGVAHELMEDIKSKWPEIDNLNKDYGPYKNLEKVITKAVATEGRKPLLLLQPRELFNPKNWIFGLWDATLGNPHLKAEIAFALDKARTAAGGNVKANVSSIKEIEKEVAKVKSRVVERPDRSRQYMPVEEMMPGPSGVPVTGNIPPGMTQDVSGRFVPIQQVPTGNVINKIYNPEEFPLSPWERRW